MGGKGVTDTARLAAARRFLDRTPLPALLVGRDRRIVAANTHTENALGHPTGGLDGSDSLELVHPDDRELANKLFVEVVAGRLPRGVHERLRLLHSSGASIPYEVAATNLLDDPAMGGLLITALPVDLPDPRAAWFEAVVSSIADGVLVVDPEGRIAYAGPGLDEFTGIPARNLVGRRLPDLAQRMTPAEVADWLTGVVAEPGAVATTAAVITDRHGREHHLEIRARNFVKDGTVDYVVIVARDVTERRRLVIEARLAARLVEASPVVVLATDAEGRVMAWNRATEELLGWPAEEAIGRTFRELGGHTDESLAKIYDNLPVLLQGGTVEFEAEVHRRDGTRFPAYIVSSGLLDDTGNFDGFLVFGFDLSVEHQSRHGIAAREARWSAVARRSRELVAILDDGGTFAYAGPGFGTILGHDPDALVGRPFGDLVHPDDRARPGGIDEVLAGTATTLERDHRLRHADGSWRVIELEMSDQRDERYVHGFVLIGRDVTDRVAIEAANQYLAAAVDSTGAAVLVLGLDRRVVGWNRGAERLLGWPAEECLGSTPPITPVDDAAADALLSVEREGATADFEAAALRKDSSAVLLAINASPVRDTSGTIVGTTWVAMDVTEKRAADRERELRAAQQSVIAAVTGRALGGAPIDVVIDEAVRMASSTLAATVTAELHDVPPETPPPAGTFTCAIEGRDGTVGTLTAVSRANLPLGDADIAFLQALANVLGTVVDRGRVTDEMRRRALHDDLTDLPNRTLLVDRLDQAIRRSDRRDECVAVLFVDLDRFKNINDTMGHAAGDEVLCETARRLTTAVRAGDTVGRVGGDEFVILCEDVENEAEATALAGRILDALSAPVAVGSTEVSITASVGVVVCDEAADAEMLVREADLAMYKAKQRGRARVEVFDEAMRVEVASRIGAEQALREAVAAGRLTVVYQPQIDLVDGTLVGVEALVRWDDAGSEPVEPSALVAETGLADEISRFVLHDACRTLASLRAGGNDVRVSVNVGARQLAHPALTGRIGAALEKADVPPDALVLEVTETDLVDDTAGPMLAELRSLGVRVSLDDFGTGWSSLHRLTRLPVDEVKVDQSFIAGVGSDPGCDAVVRAVASLAAELRLRLVAEGVERADQRQRLVELGCRIGQGWFLGAPVPGSELGAGV